MLLRIRQTILLVSACLSVNREILEDIMNNSIKHRPSRLRHVGCTLRQTTQDLTNSHRGETLPQQTLTVKQATNT